ncbi:MAG: exodeoxyribonuclease VII large subunit, partial [Planctomycetota bacterium]
MRWVDRDVDCGDKCRMPERPKPDREPSLFDDLSSSDPAESREKGTPPAKKPARKKKASKRAGPQSDVPNAEIVAARSSSAAPSAHAATVSPAPKAAPAGPRVVAVGELTRELSARMHALGRVAVEGEISGLKRAGSGHIYFGLKDDDAYLNCAIWRSRVASAARFPLEEGMRVVCHGKLDVYSPRGTYSLMVEKVEQRGIGELLARLEELKAEWRMLGRFDRARPIPGMPRCVGVVTSRDTAAFQDFLRTRSLRWPLYPVRLVHTRVQGREAAREIADAITRLDASGVDVIVVARGGGSLEDLWCFNEVIVAEAIWKSSTPVISGVGHETDWTLTDLVADLRAHTPTDAAQTVIPDRAALLERLERAGSYLIEAANRAVEVRVERLNTLASGRTMRDASWILGDRIERLRSHGVALVRAAEHQVERMERRLERAAEGLTRQSPRVRLAKIESRLTPLQPRLDAAMHRRLSSAEAKLEVADRTLSAISPFNVLERGYSITRLVDQSGTLRSVGDLSAGDRIETVLASGSIVSAVQETR